MNTKGLIEHTAFRLFLNKGFTDVSINDIIGELDITKGCFYHHFKSKDELIGRVFNTYIHRYFENAIIDIESSALNAKEKIKGLCDKLANYEEYVTALYGSECGDFKQFYLLMMEGIKKFSYIMDFRTEFYNHTKAFIIKTVNEGKQQGVIKQPVNAENVAVRLLAYSEGILFLNVMDNDIRAKETMENSFDELWESITA